MTDDIFLHSLFFSFLQTLTAFLQFQEFSLRNMTVASSTTAARRSPQSSNQNAAASLPRR
jgi:hypothetical protein